MNYLLDTDTCIYWLKGRPAAVRERLLEVGWDQVCICVITVAELYFGAYNSSRVDENLARVEAFVTLLPNLSLTDASLRKYAELKAMLRKAGQPVADLDLIIASVAISANLILVTNNTRHYARISELQLENWV